MFVAAVLEGRNLSQPVPPEVPALTQEADVVAAAACLGLQAFKQYARTVAEHVMKAAPDPLLHSAACRLVWSLAVFGDLTPSDCERLLQHPRPLSRSLQVRFNLHNVSFRAF